MHVLLVPWVGGGVVVVSLCCAHLQLAVCVCVCVCVCMCVCFRVASLFDPIPPPFHPHPPQSVWMRVLPTGTVSAATCSLRHTGARLAPPQDRWAHCGTMPPGCPRQRRCCQARRPSLDCLRIMTRQSTLRQVRTAQLGGLGGGVGCRLRPRTRAIVFLFVFCFVLFLPSRDAFVVSLRGRVPSDESDDSGFCSEYATGGWCAVPRCRLVRGGGVVVLPRVVAAVVERSCWQRRGWRCVCCCQETKPRR